METKYTLRLKEFESNIGDVWKCLQKESQFHDVTLATEDYQIKAHKLVLSACSPVLEKFLKNNSNQNTLIYLRGAESTHLSQIVDFIYQGEVSIQEVQLKQFMSLAEDLKIKGLVEENQRDSTFTNQQSELYAEKGSLSDIITSPDVEPITKSVDSDANRMQEKLKAVVNAAPFQQDLQKSIENKFSKLTEQTFSNPVHHENLGGLPVAPFQQDLVENLPYNSIPDQALSSAAYNKDKSDAYKQNANLGGLNTGGMKEEPLEAPYDDESGKISPYQDNDTIPYQDEDDTIPYKEEDDTIPYQEDDEMTDAKVSNTSQENNVKKDFFYPEPQMIHKKTPKKKESNHSIAVLDKNNRFSCEVCEKSFSSSGNLSEHKRRKHDGLKFYCEQCDYKAVRKGVLRKHVNSVHGNL